MLKDNTFTEPRVIPFAHVARLNITFRIIARILHVFIAVICSNRANP